LFDIAGKEPQKHGPILRRFTMRSLGDYLDKIKSFDIFDPWNIAAIVISTIITAIIIL